jgi:hypothetical protein
LTTLNEGKLVIRSFLFLTNDGTPEGWKLRALTGLAKRDKKYLEIEKPLLPPTVFTKMKN